MNPKVDFYFDKAKKWQEEVNLLRDIALSCDLAEELKWGQPCYTLGKSNIVLIHDFKEYCALLFFKGVLLKDTDHLLIQQTGNVQAARQIRFTSADEIRRLSPSIRSYIAEAVEAERSGRKVPMKKTSEFRIPAEFQAKLDRVPALKTAFEKLTPGRQRAYLLYFAGAKQAKTREARIEKYLPAILAGKGMEDN